MFKKRVGIHEPISVVMIVGASGPFPDISDTDNDVHAGMRLGKGEWKPHNNTAQEVRAKLTERREQSDAS